MSDGVDAKDYGPRFPTIILMAGIFFMVGFWLHYPGLTYSYSDFLGSLWPRYGVNDGLVPYIDYNLEYPVLSGLILYVASSVKDVYGYYFILSAAIWPCVLGSIWAVYKILEGQRLSLNPITYYIIFTPSFLYFTIYSFDWLGAVFLMFSIYSAMKRHIAFSGLFMGLAAASRIIPLICLPFIARELHSKKHMAIFLAITAISWVALNLYFILSNFQGFLYPYIFQVGYRVEDSWLNIFPGISKILTFALLLPLLALIFFWWKREFSLVEECFLALLAFVLVGYKFPPQYMIMLLPFFALCRPSYALFMIANLLNIMVILWWFEPALNFGNPWEIGSPVQWLAIARQIILLPIFLSYFLKTRTKDHLCTSNKHLRPFM